jgi:hypothetical protein
MSNEKEKPQAEWFGGYQGGLLCWGTMRKRARYARKYNNTKKKTAK